MLANENRSHYSLCRKIAQVANFCNGLEVCTPMHRYQSLNEC